MFPDSGGQYVYLREAYGDLPAFLYGWMLFSVANGGTIAALSVASAAYLGGIVPFISQDHVVFSAAGIVLTRAHVVALISIIGVTWINVVGLRWGTILQNLATWAKFAAMAAFVILGFAIGKGDWQHFAAPGQSLTLGLSPGQLISAFGVALIAVFWAYDGWVYITWVSGEVKDPRRNVPLAMVLGVHRGGRHLYRHEHDLCLRAATQRGCEARDHRARRGHGACFLRRRRCGFQR